MSTDDKAAGASQPRSLRNPGHVLKVYLSASSAEMRRARTAVEALGAAGIEVVSTWIDVIDQVGNANPRDASTEDRARWSKVDLDEVLAADVLWFLVPSTHAPTRGGWLEAGLAHAHGKTLVFSGDTKQSIFCALGSEYTTDDEALKAIRKLAKGWP
jgi:hypothetical protein